MQETQKSLNYLAKKNKLGRLMAFQTAIMVKNPPANAGDIRKICGLDLCVRKIPWRRKWQPTPVFLPGKFHGQRSLAGYGP